MRTLPFPAAVLSIACSMALLAVSCGGGGDGPPGRVTVTVGGLVIDAEVARTVDERALGLGERDPIGRDEGMLFVYDKAGQETFWMRGMRFPLDFIWVDATRTVVDLTLDVPPPVAGTPDKELPTITPVAPAQYVLEVNAGLVREGGVAIGDAVTFDPEP